MLLEKVPPATVYIYTPTLKVGTGRDATVEHGIKVNFKPIGNNGPIMWDSEKAALVRAKHEAKFRILLGKEGGYPNKEEIEVRAKDLQQELEGFITSHKAYETKKIFPFKSSDEKARDLGVHPCPVPRCTKVCTTSQTLMMHMRTHRDIMGKFLGEKDKSGDTIRDSN